MVVEITRFDSSLSRGLGENVFLEGSRVKLSAAELLSETFGGQTLSYQKSQRVLPTRNFFQSTKFSEDLKWRVLAYYFFAPNDDFHPLPPAFNQLAPQVDELNDYCNQTLQAYEQKGNWLKDIIFVNSPNFHMYCGSLYFFEQVFRHNFLNNEQLSPNKYETFFGPNGFSMETERIDENTLSLKYNWPSSDDQKFILPTRIEPEPFGNFKRYFTASNCSLNYKICLNSPDAKVTLDKISFSPREIKDEDGKTIGEEKPSPEFISEIQILFFCKDLYLKQRAYEDSPSETIGGNNFALVSAFTEAKKRIKPLHGINDAEEPDLLNDDVRNQIIALTELSHYFKIDTASFSDTQLKSYLRDYWNIKQEISREQGDAFDLEDPQHRNAILQKKKQAELDEAIQTAQNAGFSFIAAQAAAFRDYLAKKSFSENPELLAGCDDIITLLDHFKTTPETPEQALQLRKKVVEGACQLAEKYTPLMNSSKPEVSAMASKIVFIAAAAILVTTVLVVLSIYCPPVGMLLGLGVAKAMGIQCGIAAAASFISVAASWALKSAVAKSYKLFLGDSQKEINAMRLAAGKQMKHLVPKSPENRSSQPADSGYGSEETPSPPSTPERKTPPLKGK